MNSRSFEYMTYDHFGFRVQYNKLFKNEYLPWRVRCSQLLFVTAMLYGYSFVRSQDFVETENKPMGARRYYSSARAYVNPIQAGLNASSARSHVAKQEFTL